MSIPLFKVFMSPDVIENIKNVIYSGTVTQGPVVDKYEKALSEYFNTNNIVTVNSATSGLTLALRLLKSYIDDDSQVLCTPLTCTATNWPVLNNNLEIKWVDVNPDTCNMDLEDLRRKLTDKTRIVLFVHWGGYPIDLKKLKEIKDEYQKNYNQELYIIEDCAHAFGSKIHDKFVGTIDTCDMSIFSTQAIKHLTTVDGGFMIIHDDKLYKRARKLRWFGIDREMRTTSNGDFRLEPDISEWGYKFHMNDLNAAIGLANLNYIDSNLNKIRKIAGYYNSHLGNVNGVKLLKLTDNCSPSYWIYTIKIVNKHEFIKYMKMYGVICSQVHNRNDTHSCVSKFKTELPSLNKLETEIICIPCGWWMEITDAEYIVKLIKDWCKINEIKIRELTEDDFSQYISLITQLNKQDGTNYCLETFKYRLNLMSQLKHHIFVAEINNIIVGTAKLIIEPKFFDSVGHIEDVIVNKDYRNMNVGRKLVDKLLDVGFCTYNCYKIVLNSNIDAVDFYTKCGFEKESNASKTETYRMNHKYTL